MMLKKIFWISIIAVISFPLFSLENLQENKLYSEEDVPAEEYLNKRSLPKDFFDSEIQKPEQTKETREKSSVEIKTNVRSAKVFLNGVYKGLTPIRIENLEIGTYRLRVEKQGFVPLEKFISVSKDMTHSYYYELKEIKGFVDVRGLPDKSFIYANNKLMDSCFFALPEGLVHIKIQSFGYEDFEADVFILRNRVKRLYVTLQKADFRIKDFITSKKAINPDYKGSLGSCTLTAIVTATESGTLVITDEKENEVFSKTILDFSTWTQEVSWKGRDSLGNPLPNGKYVATFSAAGQSKSVEVFIDHSIVFPLQDITFSGMGLGVVPTAVLMPVGTKFFNFKASPVFSSETGFYAVPLDIGFAGSVLKNLELSGMLSIFSGVEKTPMHLSLALKFAGKTKNKESAVHFRYGSALRYGFSDSKIFPDYKCDVGNGLGLSGFLGLESKMLSFDFSSEFILGSESSNPVNGDNAWKNGIAFAFIPKSELSLNASCALISASKIFNAIQTEVGVTTLIPGSSVTLNSYFYGIIYSQSLYYLGFSAGIGYLF